MFNPEVSLKEMVIAACENGASDIHFQLIDQDCRIRFRKNEKLLDYSVISRVDYLKLVLFIKYRSHLNLNHAKGPQSSAFDLEVSGKTFRIRVSCIHTSSLESLVLRITSGERFEQFDDLFYLRGQGDAILRSLKDWTDSYY